MTVSPFTGKRAPAGLDSWTVTDGARVCHVTERTIRRWITNGWLIAHRERREWRFTLAALMDAELVARLARQKRVA